MVLNIPLAVFVNYHAWRDLRFEYPTLYVLWCANCGFFAGQFDIWSGATDQTHTRARRRNSQCA